MVDNIESHHEVDIENRHNPQEDQLKIAMEHIQNLVQSHCGEEIFKRKTSKTAETTQQPKAHWTKNHHVIQPSLIHTNFQDLTP